MKLPAFALLLADHGRLRLRSGRLCRLRRPGRSQELLSALSLM